MTCACISLRTHPSPSPLTVVFFVVCKNLYCWFLLEQDMCPSGQWSGIALSSTASWNELWERQTAGGQHDELAGSSRVTSPGSIVEKILDQTPVGQCHAVAVVVLQAQYVQGVTPSVLGVQQPQGGLPLVAEERAKDEAAHRYDHDSRVAAGW